MSALRFQNSPEKLQRLCDLFGFTSVEEIIALNEGYRAQNFLVRADDTRYFLKVYHRIGHVAHQITRAQRFFFKHGVPVLLPIQDRYDRFAFCFDSVWCSLFPYIEGIKKQSLELDDVHLCALGTLLARMHTLGAHVDTASYDHIQFWQHENFLWEYHKLMDLLDERTPMRKVDKLVKQTLEEKRKIVESFKIETINLPQTHPILIHGDLIYQNVFWNDGEQITSVFDFEKTCIAPRGYEIARSLMINCFDEGWGEKQFRRAQIFLDTYRESINLSFDEFLNGMCMYWMNVAHMTWLEIKHLMSNQDEPSHIYQYHANRIAHLGNADPVQFCEKIYRNR